MNTNKQLRDYITMPQEAFDTVYGVGAFDGVTGLVDKRFGGFGYRFTAFILKTMKDEDEIALRVALDCKWSGNYKPTHEGNILRKRIDDFFEVLDRLSFPLVASWLERGLEYYVGDGVVHYSDLKQTAERLARELDVSDEANGLRKKLRAMGIEDKVIDELGFYPVPEYDD